jgi:hypothetical protein
VFLESEFIRLDGHKDLSEDSEGSMGHLDLTYGTEAHADR